MKRSKFTEQQIFAILKEAETGLFDPGPFVATGFRIFLGLVMVWHRRGRF